MSHYGTSQGSSVCDVITLVKFLSVGLLLVNSRLTVGILLADSWPTVYRQTFRGAVLRFLPKLSNLYPRSIGLTGSALQLLLFPVTLVLHIHQSHAYKFLRERHSGVILQIWI